MIDSGASVHVTSRRDLFNSYTPGDFGNVKMAHEGVAKCAGVGQVCLEMSNGSKLILKHVKYVPDIRLNLLSVGKLCDENYDSLFSGDSWKLTKGSMVVGRGSKHSTLYITQAKIVRDVVHAAEFVDGTDLWHKRLCHMSEKGMSTLARKNMLSGIRKTHLQKCSHCFAGKQNRVSFKSHPPSRKSEILDLVHSDICGLMKTRTLGGSVYFVTFIDDHSRKLWVYTLKTKDQVLSVFKLFQALVERETGKKLKCIRTDNGGEYLGPFDAYCKMHGIRHQRTPPKTPQLNGLAERMNKTLVERVRCLLSQAGLPNSFWREALSTVVYVLNRSPSIPL